MKVHRIMPSIWAQVAPPMMCGRGFYRYGKFAERRAGWKGVTCKRCLAMRCPAMEKK